MVPCVPCIVTLTLMCKVWKVANILFIYASHKNCIRKITMSLLPLLFGLNLWVLITNANLTFQRSNAGIRRVSDTVDDIDSNVIEIDLSDNEITRIYHRDFANFRQCQKLNLFRNNIHTLDVGAFEGMVSLYQLILWGNKLTSFPNLTVYQDYRCYLYQAISYLELCHLMFRFPT